MQDRDTTRLNQGERDSKIPLESCKKNAAYLQLDVGRILTLDAITTCPDERHIVFHPSTELDSAADLGHE